MREILFRGKKQEDGEWICGNLTIWSDKTVSIDEEPTEASILWAVIPETVGQYTGLTDKNGKKIFEGDIVKCRHSWRLQVYPNDGIDGEKYFFEQKIRGAYGKYKHESPYSWWGDEYFYFRNYAVEYYAPNGGFRVRNGGQFHELTSNYISNRSLEVIGNIHENPELLKGE